MSRRKSVIVPSGGPSPPEKKFRSPFSAFRRTDSSRSFHQMDDQPLPPNGLHPIPSKEEERPPSSAQNTSEMNRIPESAPVTAPKTNGNVIPEEPEVAHEPPAENKREADTIPESSSVCIRRESSHFYFPANVSQSPQVDADGYSERPDTIDEITKVQREAAGT